MKISTWRQFSSNHSSSFTVVGEFANRADAERAAEEVRGILTKIEAWYAQQDASVREKWAGENWMYNPTPPEVELAAQYGVAWQRAIDWFSNAEIKVELDRFLFISPDDLMHIDGYPFDQIVERLGGKGYYDGYLYGFPTGWILVDLTCRAPDEEMARGLYVQYLGFSRRIRRSGANLHFYRWRFDEVPMLPELVEELKSYGCTDIEYALTQIQPGAYYDLYDSSDIDVLVEILQGSRGDIGDALQAAATLAMIGDGRAVEPLIVFLHNEAARQQAIHALGWMGAVAREGVLKAIDAEPTGDESVRAPLTVALQRIDETIAGGEALKALRSLDQPTSEAAFQKLREARDVDTLLAFLHNPSLITVTTYQMRMKVMDALAGWAEQDGRIIPALVEHVVDYSGATLPVLIRIGSPAALAAAREIAAHHPTEWIREYAAKLLEQLQ